MANISIERSVSALDNLNRSNLLDVVLERSRASKNTKAVCFLFYIAQLKESECSMPNSMLVYERFLKSISVTNKALIDSLSGILLFYSGKVVHVIEGPETVICDFINGVISGNLIWNSKVVVYSSNVPFRLFSQFSSQILSVPFVNFDFDTKAEEFTEKQVEEALTVIISLSKEMNKVPRKLLRLFLEELSTKHSNLVLPVIQIENLLKSKDLLSLNMFYEKQFLSWDIVVSENELAWPITSIDLPVM